MLYVNYRSLSSKILFFVFFLLFQACITATPTGIEAVTNFEIDKYLGTWYEIARLDHSFERNIEKVTATYHQQPDGTIRVENSGFHQRGGKRKVMVGKAKFAGDKKVGHLKVSFLPHIYGTYIVFYIEPDYSVALVCGHNKNFCWILSRKPAMSEEELNKYINILKEKGFSTEKLLFPTAYNDTLKNIADMQPKR